MDKRLELPRAVAAVYKVIEQGCETHPGEQDPFPPPYSTFTNIFRALIHLVQFIFGVLVDEHGMNMLAKVCCRLMFILEKMEKDAAERQSSEGDSSSRYPRPAA